MHHIHNCFDVIHRRVLQNTMSQVEDVTRLAARAAGARPEDLVRATWFITDRDAYLAAGTAIGEAWRRHIGRHYPAMSVVVVSALLEPGALVEIEATAIQRED